MRLTELDVRAHTRLKFAIDLFLWSVAGVLAFVLRQPGDFGEMGASIPLFALCCLPIQAALIWRFRLPRQVWRQVSIQDLTGILQAVGVGTAIFFSLGAVWHQVTLFPRTAPLIGGVLAIVGMGGMRLVLRLYYEDRGRTDAASFKQVRRVLLVGAGSAGGRMARDIRRHPASGMKPVGFLDDDARKQGVSVSGIRVLGRIDDLPAICREHKVDEILITMPSAPGRTTRHIVDVARHARVACRILPGVTEILAGAGLWRVRDVQVEDLLRRRPIELDFHDTGDYLRGSTVLVTGAGGSIGSELVRQVARLGPSRVLLLGQGENSVHQIQQELVRDLPGLDQVAIVASIRDREKLEYVMDRYQPDVVLHAAAHKHVPLMESDPDEAVLNNVGGTQNVARAALDAGVRRFVNISTDKAVHPRSFLGATKQLAEQVVRAIAAEAGHHQAFVSVRFGNVLGSRGSVIPIFQEQIGRGGPLTLTHPDATRYFMTIPEASRLVIQAGALGENGSVYILDMGEPVRIVDLARDMIRLSNADPDDVPIVYTGLRPGERLEEELFDESEHAGRTRFEQILVGRSERDPSPDFLDGIDHLLKVATERDMPGIGTALAELVDGFSLPRTSPSYRGAVTALD